MKPVNVYFSETTVLAVLWFADPQCTMSLSELTSLFTAAIVVLQVARSSDTPCTLYLGNTCLTGQPVSLHTPLCNVSVSACALPPHVCSDGWSLATVVSAPGELSQIRKTCGCQLSDTTLCVRLHQQRWSHTHQIQICRWESNAARCWNKLRWSKIGSPQIVLSLCFISVSEGDDTEPRAAEEIDDAEGKNSNVVMGEWSPVMLSEWW